MAKWKIDGGLDLGLGWAIHLEVLVQPGPVQPVADSPSLRSNHDRGKVLWCLMALEHPHADS